MDSEPVSCALCVTVSQVSTNFAFYGLFRDFRITPLARVLATGTSHCGEVRSAESLSAMPTKEQGKALATDDDFVDHFSTCIIHSFATGSFTELKYNHAVSAHFDI